jgi:hypothetical protein
MTADSVYSLANWTLVGALIVGVLSTYAIVVSGNIKEKAFKLELSKANEGAEKAKRDAANAEVNITRLKVEADKQIALLNTEAMKSKEEIAKAQIEVAKANEKAETERLERIQLESELAPRTLEQRQSAKELFKFQGINVIIESLAESDPWRTAGQIAWTLENAKWIVLPGMKRFLDATHFFDGVAIETNVGARQQDDHSIEAADSLVAVLEKNNIKAHRRPSVDNLPLNTIKIRVGLKPAEYFQRNRNDFEYGNMLYK